MPQTTTSQTQDLTNPYAAAHVGVPAIELQLLLLGAVACFVVGYLLAEQTTLRRILSTIDASMLSHARTETL